MKLVDGQPVADSYYEYGVCYQTGYTVDCDDEENARFEAELSDAKVVRRHVYVMEWEEFSPESESESSAPVPGNAQGHVPGLDDGEI